jgi:hypothetical protein
MAIGVTGGGKSAFLSELLGLQGNERFASSLSPESKTMSTCLKDKIRGDVKYIAVDTPGFDDSQERDDEHIIDMCRVLKELRGGVNGIAIVSKMTDYRFAGHQQKVLRIAFNFFHNENFFHHLCLVATHADERSGQYDERKQARETEYRSDVVRFIKTLVPNWEGPDPELRSFFVDNVEGGRRSDENFRGYQEWVASLPEMETVHCREVLVDFESVEDETVNALVNRDFTPVYEDITETSETVGPGREIEGRVGARI